MPEQDPHAETSDNTMSTEQLFDKTFKHIFGNASSSAIVGFINGSFGAHHPPGSAVAFQPTESIVKTADGKMQRQTSDMILTVDGKPYVIEVQTGDDETIALRVFEYGLSYAIKGRTINDNGELIEVTLPRGMVIYWEGSGRTPDKATFRIKTPEGKTLDYEITVLKVLDHALAELDRRNLSLISPFYLLKVRREVKKGVSPERLKELARTTGKIEREMVNLFTQARTEGRLSDGDVVLLESHILDLHEKLYKEYEPFKEVYMEMDSEIRTPYFDEYMKLKRESEERLHAMERAQQAQQQAQQENAELRRQLAAYQAQAAQSAAARPVACWLMAPGRHLLRRATNSGILQISPPTCA
jgi:hypothetical protein